jgi:hypothetical protein
MAKVFWYVTKPFYLSRARTPLMHVESTSKGFHLYRLAFLNAWVCLAVASQAFILRIDKV